MEERRAGAPPRPPTAAFVGPSAVVVAGLLTVALAVTPAAAQTDGTIVGALLGGGETTQIWSPEEDTESVRGLIAGAFADVATPLAGLRVRAEGAFTRRGGNVVLDSGGQPVSGGARTNYLSIGVHLVLARALGPVRVHVAGGPTLDQTLSSTLDPVLAQVLEEESAVVFAMSIGTGVGAWVSDRLFLGLDLRLTEGLGDAYSGSFTGFHNRTVEARLRAGVPLAWLRDR